MDEWVKLAQTVSGFSTAFTFVALIVGGVIGLARYKRSQKIGAAELLLKLEAEFRNVLPVCVLWEIPDSYQEKIKPTLMKYWARGANDQGGDRIP